MRFWIFPVFAMSVVCFSACDSSEISQRPANVNKNQPKPPEKQAPSAVPNPAAQQRKRHHLEAVAAFEKLGGKISCNAAKSVVRVDLSYSIVDDADLVQLKQFPDLERLNLSETAVTESGLKHLKGLTKLRVLRLRRAANDAGLAHLKELPNLQVLDLFQTEITDAGLKQVAQMKKLKELDIRRTNRVGDEGIALLKNLTTLRNLKIQETREVTNACVKHLKVLTNLERLGLSGQNFSDSSLEQLAALTKLKSLELDHTVITDAGLEHLKGMQNLEVLHCRLTQIGDAGLTHLKGLTRMKRTDVPGHTHRQRRAGQFEGNE